MVDLGVTVGIDYISSVFTHTTAFIGQHLYIIECYLHIATPDYMSIGIAV